MKVSRTNDELLSLLKEQIGFLQSSAESFDSGYDGEAKRMATTVRILCHDTSASISLLKQLGLKVIQFYDTVYPDLPGNVAPFVGMCRLKLVGQAAGDGLGPSSGWEARLDNFTPSFVPASSSFDIWWAAKVIDDRNGHTLTRRQVTLEMANTDGGAHVDPKLDAQYAAISRQVGFGVYRLEGDKIAAPLNSRVERLTMRQIAHEVLTTLRRQGYNRE